MAVGDAYVFPGFLTPVLTQLFFPKSPTTFLTCFCRGERRKWAGKKGRLNRGSNSQPQCHQSNTLTTDPPGRGEFVFQSFCRGERRKWAGKKGRLNRGSNSQPQCHQSMDAHHWSTQAGRVFQSPTLDLVKPRKDMNNVSCRRDMTEILFKTCKTPFTFTFRIRYIQMVIFLSIDIGKRVVLLP